MEQYIWRIVLILFATTNGYRQAKLRRIRFPKIISQLASYAICKSAQNKIFTLQPSGKYNEVLEALETVQEKLYIKNKGLVFPALEFEELIHELKILPIENSVLSVEGVQRILLASNMVNAILQFLEKIQDLFIYQGSLSPVITH